MFKFVYIKKTVITSVVKGQLILSGKISLKLSQTNNSYLQPKYEKLQNIFKLFFSHRTINLRQRKKYVNVERLAASNEFWLDPLMEFDLALGEITINAKMMILCLMLSLFKFAFSTIENSFCLRRPTHFKIDDPNRIK